MYAPLPTADRRAHSRPHGLALRGLFGLSEDDRDQVTDLFVLKLAQVAAVWPFTLAIQGIACALLIGLAAFGADNAQVDTQVSLIGIAAQSAILLAASLSIFATVRLPALVTLAPACPSPTSNTKRPSVAPLLSYPLTKKRNPSV